MMKELVDDYKFFVLGATGYLGKNLYDLLVKEGFECVGTSRNENEANGLCVYDIENDSVERLIKYKSYKKSNVVLFCIAASNIKWCEENRERAWRINVERTCEVIKILLENGFRVIWFSSDNVFDGRKGNYTEKDKVNPINVYGETKASTEKYILDAKIPVCILRLSKVVGPYIDNKNIFTEWQKQIDHNEVIRCIKENRFSPVCIEDVFNIILCVVYGKLSGLYNCGGNKSYTRYELVKKFANLYCPNYENIVESVYEEFGFIGERPLDIGMICEKITNELRYVVRDIDEEMYIYIKNMEGHSNG